MMVEARLRPETLHQFAKRQRIFDSAGHGPHLHQRRTSTQVIPGRAYSYDDDGEGGFCLPSHQLTAG